MGGHNGAGFMNTGYFQLPDMCGSEDIKRGQGRTLPQAPSFTMPFQNLVIRIIFQGERPIKIIDKRFIGYNIIVLIKTIIKSANRAFVNTGRK